eukprot:204258_1
MMTKSSLQNDDATTPFIIYILCLLINPFNAQYIYCGSSTSGYTSSSYPTDNYYITLDQSYSSISISTCGSSYDTLLYFYDTSGNQLDYCDDCGSCSSNNNEILTYTPSGEFSYGTYKIGIRGYNNAFGHYEIKVTCTTTVTPSPTPLPTYYNLYTPSPTCDWSYNTCSNGNGCYPESYKCDGYPDCADGSDEYGCTSSSPSSSSSVSGVSAGVITIIIVIVLLILCVSAFIIYRRKKKQSQTNEAKFASVNVNNQMIQTGLPLIITTGSIEPTQTKGKSGYVSAASVPLRTSEADRFSITTDDDMSNTDLISDHYVSSDSDDAGQKNLPFCWYCRPNFSLFCRFRFFYFFYYLSYETGILYITNELASAQLKNGQDDFEIYNGAFLAIAALICFAFSIFLGKLSDIHGRKRYIRYTVLITMIPFLGVLILPDIYLYFGLLPLVGFVGATSTFTGLFITYVTDVMPKAYLAAGFAAIQSTEGTAGLFAATIIGIIGYSTEKDDYRTALGVVNGFFVLTVFISLCLIRESLPLNKRNLNPVASTKSKYNFFQIWLDTLKENKLLYFMCIFYFFILFSFAGLEELIHQKSSFIKLFEGAFDSDSDSDGDGNKYFIYFLVISIGIKVGKSFTPLVLFLTGCCIKTILNKIIFFIMTLVMALLLFVTLQGMEGLVFHGEFSIDDDVFIAIAAVAGITFAWAKLILPLINVLVRGSSNKLERGRTFGVLSSVESICNYVAPLTIVHLWNGDANLRILSVVVCFITVIIASIWLHVKIRPVLTPQAILDAKSVSSINAVDNANVIPMAGSTAGAPSALVQLHTKNNLL